MIKQGLKNYFKNLKYFLTPLGAMTLGAILGLSILLPGLMNSIEKLAREVQNILAETNIDFAQLKNQLAIEIRALDWSNPMSAATTMLGNEWLTNTLNSCIGTLVGGSEIYVSQLSAAVDLFSAEIVGYLVGFFIFTGLGLVGGFIFTKWIIRRDIAKRSIFKFILVSIFDGILTLAFLVAAGWLTSLWKPSVYISVFIFLLLFGLESLIEAYLIQGRKKVDAKKVINFKNIISLFAVDIIIIAITVVFVVAVAYIINKIVALFVGLALLQIAIIVMDLNAESYVKSLLKEEPETPASPETPSKKLKEAK